MDHIFGQFSPDFFTPPHFQIHFNIILLYTPKHLPLTISDYSFACIYYLHHAFYMSCQYLLEQ